MLDKIEKLLLESYSKDICYPKVSEKWTEQNRCWGMCAITALVVDDYLNAQIGKIYVDGISHYFNVLNGEIIDFTKSQFEHKIDYSGYKLVDRGSIMSNEDTKERYKELRRRILRLG